MIFGFLGMKPSVAERIVEIMLEISSSSPRLNEGQSKPSVSFFQKLIPFYYGRVSKEN